MVRWLVTNKVLSCAAEFQTLRVNLVLMVKKCDNLQIKQKQRF